MFRTLQKEFPKDNDFPERTFRLQVWKRVLDGELYDKLQHSFQEESTDAGEYVPLRKRRPCVRSNLCRTVVDDSVSLLFSEGHFPTFELPDEQQKLAFHKLVKETKLNEVMIDAATRGSVGSVAIMFKVLKNRVFFEVMDTSYLTPKWDPEAPDTLLSVTEKYKVEGSALAALGYSIKDDDLKAKYWFQRVWNADAEEWYAPWKVGSDTQVPQGKAYKPLLDKAKTVKHELGFVPIAWVKNLPGGDAIDGLPTFPSEAIDDQIEIDYQLSQAGRGLKYTADPTLLIKEPGFGENGPTVKGAANAIKVSEGGDAKLLEINGTGSAAVIEYVKHLREIALETMHGSRTSPEKMASAQSGRAMELMQQALVWLADRLRITYGEGALIDLAGMIVRASVKFALVFKSGDPVGQFDTKVGISLRWPAWYSPTASDRAQEASTLKIHTDAGHMSNETAVKAIAGDYDIEDVPAELAAIANDRKERLDALAAASQVQTKVSVTD